MNANRFFAFLSLFFAFEGLFGCAGPTHIMNLPSTIPSGKVGLQLSNEGAPESGNRMANDSIKYNEYSGSIGFDYRHRIFNSGIFGIQADYNLFTSGQLSTSFSYQPIDMWVGSVWVGIDPRAGSIGGFEMMTGTQNISIGCGYALMRSVTFIDYGWDGSAEPTTWSRHFVPYGRIAGGWNGCELDLRVGKATSAWQPWMWQAEFRWSIPIHEQ